jgi:hypothetical protein
MIVNKSRKAIIMWATEYTIHEHRKELLRTAAQVRLVREAQAQPRAGVTRWWAHELALQRVRWLQPFRRLRRQLQPLLFAAHPISLRRTT